MQPTLHRTNSENADFIELVKLLDAGLAILDGDEHPFFAQFNKIDKINEVVLAYVDGGWIQRASNMPRNIPL